MTAAGWRFTSPGCRHILPAMLPPGFYWEPNHHKPGALWLLRRDGHLVVGGVWPRLDGSWMAAINRHRFRYPTAVAPRRDVAIRWVERWCRARAAALATVKRELSPGEISPPVATWGTGERPGKLSARPAP